MKILIAGCGYVGSELARRLLGTGGHEVWALKRRPVGVPAGVKVVACDLATRSGIGAIPDGLDAVVYAVGADASTPEAYEQAYVRALANLGSELQSRGAFPSRLVVVTSTAVYGQDDGSWVDESSVTEPSGFSGRILLESEALSRRMPTRSVVVRFGGIYGPGRTRFIDSVRGGTAKPGPGVEFTNRIHRDDCAGVLEHLLHLASPDGLYVGVDDEPVDRRVVIDWLARQIGVPCPESEKETSRRHPRGKRCSNRRLRASGYEFLFPTFREGYAAVLAGEA